MNTTRASLSEMWPSSPALKASSKLENWPTNLQPITRKIIGIDNYLLIVRKLKIFEIGGNSEKKFDFISVFYCARLDTCSTLAIVHCLKQLCLRA
jgi:hypothetical protein